MGPPSGRLRPAQQLVRRLGLRASLHLADALGATRCAFGDPYDMKTRTVLRRVGIDTAVVAGTAPARRPDA